MVLFTAIAVFIRPYVTNKQTRKYFLPALWIRFAGAIALGLVYQFYYEGGDTFNYWEHGSRWIHLAFQEDFVLGIRLLMEAGGKWSPELYAYTSNIWYYKDPASYAIVKMAAFFDLFTLHTYSATALFFSAFSFSGLWALFTILQEKYASNTGRLVIAILFIPSVIFWGSGILKDSITLGALGWMTWALFRLIDLGKRGIFDLIVFLLSFIIILRIKVYIIICFLPMVAIWLFFKSISRVRSLVLKALLVPILFIIFGVTGYLTLTRITEDDKKYSLDNLAERSRITAYDIRYGWGARTGGDGGYDIGLPDGSWQSMFGLIPDAIIVSLFRPYFWEVKNPMMLLTAIESFVILVLAIQLLVSSNKKFIFREPFFLFCLCFSLVFAFAVGISTFNFGTLARYKLPILPFIWIILLFNPKKLPSLNERS